MINGTGPIVSHKPALLDSSSDSRVFLTSHKRAHGIDEVDDLGFDACLVLHAAE